MKITGFTESAVVFIKKTESTVRPQARMQIPVAQLAVDTKQK